MSQDSVSGLRKKMTANGVGLLLLLPPPLFWAGNFLVGRMVHETVPPMALLFWRWIIAFVVLLPFGWSAVRRDLPHYWRRRWRVLGVSVAGIVAFNSFVYIGLRSTTASNALLFNSLIPILTALVAAIFLRQRLRPIQVFGLLLSFAGVLVIVTGGDPSRIASLSLSRGDLIVLCAMVAWTFYTIWLRGFPAELERVGLMVVQIGVGIIVILPLFLTERAFGLTPVWNSMSLALVVYLGIFPSVAAYLLYNIAVARVGVASASLSIHLIPVFGVLLAMVFLKEQVHFYHATGIAAIAAGILCVMKGRQSPSGVR